MRGPFRPLERLWSSFTRIYQGTNLFRLLLMSVVVGMLAGLAASLFFVGVEGVRHLILSQAIGLSLPAPSGEELFTTHGDTLRLWALPTATTLVGLLTGWLVLKLIPDAQQDRVTDGTDAMTRSFHLGNGRIKPLVPLVKGCTAILTIASGGSAGREGPITQVGAGLGSWVARVFGLSSKERRLLLLAGAGGGLGAIFRAPLGGAITSVEIIYTEDFESEALLPAIVSSVIAYTVFTAIYGNQAMFEIPHFVFHPWELGFYILLALFCALTGWIYVKTFRFIKYSFFQRIKEKVGLILTTGLGGLLVGCMGLVFPHVLSGGYGWVEMAILGELSILTMLLLLIGKTVATSVTIGSEMSGGMFAPALFVGGMSGGIVGKVCASYFPNMVSQPGGYVLVGMAAFFAGVGSAPVGPFILVCELTQDYGLLAPLMLASAVCIFLTQKVSLYQNQMENKFESPAHAGELFADILQNHKVQELRDQLHEPSVLSENTPFTELKKIFSATEQHYFPVVDEEDRLTGIFSSNDFRSVLFSEHVEDLVLVKDIATSDIITTTPEEDLSTALTKFTIRNIDALPVVEDQNPDNIIGMLRRREVIAFYNQQMEKLGAGASA
ncbi:MAG: chloride channel protein [Desulfohalobiaceae bacterium]